MELKKYKEIKGDLIKLAQAGEFDAIAHCTNCFNTMKAGIAKSIKEAFPEAYEVDRRTTSGEYQKLGNISFAAIENINQTNHYFWVFNLYAQYGYNPKDKPFDYEAFTVCLRKINRLFAEFHIGFPQIGAGLAGGDWERIREIIKKEMVDCYITVVIFNK